MCFTLWLSCSFTNLRRISEFGIILLYWKKDEEHGSNKIELKIRINPTVKKDVCKYLLVMGATKALNMFKTRYRENEEHYKIGFLPSVSQCNNYKNKKVKDNF